jgi:hypothetical protein
MPKTIILAIFTLLLAVAALVTNVVRPYAGDADSSTASTAPIQANQPARSPLRVPVRGPVMEASNVSNFGSI